MVEFIDVNKKYKNKTVLNNISFKLKKGEITGLLGLNGAGKTTIMKIISNLTNINSGTVNINDEIKMGFMIESPTFYEDLSGYNNLYVLSKLFDNISKEDIIKLLNEVGLNNQKNKLYKDYSLGMKQRLYFAYVLLNNPDLLILDEPFNGVDPVTANMFKKLIIDYKNKGKTILISSHILYDIHSLSDNILILDNGIIKLDDSIKNIADLEETFINTVSKDGLAQ